MLRIIEAIIAVVFIFWLIGLFLKLFGFLIHIALVVIVILVIVRVVQGRKTA